MIQYQVREANKPNKKWVEIWANNPQDAIDRLRQIGKWRVAPDVVELIQIRVAVPNTETYALTPDGVVLPTI